MAARSPTACLWVRIPPGVWMFVICECCMLSGRGLYLGLITRPKESNQVWCVWVWLRGPVKGGCDPESDRSVTGKTIYIYIYIHIYIYIYLRVFSMYQLTVWNVALLDEYWIKPIWKEAVFFPAILHCPVKSISLKLRNSLKRRNYRMNIVLYYSKKLHFAHATFVYVTYESQNKRRLLFS